MRSSIFNLGLIAVCITGLSTIAHAQGYYGNQQQSANSGYYSNQPSQVSGYYSNGPSSSTSSYSSTGSNSYYTSASSTGYQVGSTTKKHHHRSKHYYSSTNIPIVINTHSHSHYSHHHDRPLPLVWRITSYGEYMPPNAVIGGYENGSPLFVCHADYNGGTHIGKVVNGNCYFGWGGREIVTSNYEVLSTTTPLSWIPASNGYVPPYAVQGGEQNGGQPLFVCQAYFHGSMHPGKIVGQFCNISWGGQEIVMRDYNVLVS